MKRKRAVKISTLLLTTGLLLTGCGDAPIELTSQEQQIIAQYSAHVVTKYNLRQKEGIVPVSSELMEKMTAEPETEMPEEQDTQPDEQQPGDGGESRPAENHASLTQILGLDGLQATYAGAELVSTWREGETTQLIPTAGKQFLIVHITLSNPGEADIPSDILGTRSVFQVSLNGSDNIPAQTTILLNDLGTYQGIVPAGASVETVLVFEVPLEGINSVDRMALQIIRDEVRWNVDL